MKKFKLNAVLASVLSLGIVCSSPAFAAKKGVRVTSKLNQELVPVFQRQNEILNPKMIAELKQVSEKSKVVDKSEEVPTGYRLQRLKACSGKSIYIGEKLKRIIGRRLIKIFAVNFNWDDQVKESFLRNKWKDFLEFPGINGINMDKFIEELDKNSDEFIQILKSLKNCSRENGLKIESSIFSGLIRNCMEIKRQLSYWYKNF